ncbi:hypothetical protein Y1Q_0016849 [Alligator mississippiensis]|uniref:Uncharacterized protein n=1 Tax=Alligator mississippiensis TaxID=8496 RepID=A0A151P6N6_ALLMI|nr:hypothetical protein Y1Q_0016849 [Alligator mississippiensis]
MKNLTVIPQSISPSPHQRGERTAKLEETVLQCQEPVDFGIRLIHCWHVWAAWFLVGPIQSGDIRSPLLCFRNTPCCWKLNHDMTSPSLDKARNVHYRLGHTYKETVSPLDRPKYKREWRVRRSDEELYDTSE